MDLAELGVVAKQDGVKETGDALDKLAGSATNAEEKVNRFNSESVNSSTATGAMTGYVDEAAAAFSRMGPLVLAAVAAVAAFAGAALSIDKFVDATSEAAANQAQLQAALKSTQGASGQTIESLNKHAEALQKVTNYEDDTVSKAQSVLLTFTKVGGEVFPKATEAAADLAARMGGDLQSATLQVGKALQDPIRGISALSRAGIQFTEDQKEMIKGFVEANDIMSAQKVILGELETQFGGSAEAARATLGGAITSLQNAFGNLFEVAGPATENLRLAIEQLIEAMDNDAFRDFANTIGTVMFTALELAVKGFALLVEGISSFWGYAGPTIKEFGDLLYQLGSVIIPAIGEAFQKVWEIVGPIIQYFLEGWKEVYEVLKQIIGIQDEVQTPETPAAATAANDNAAPSATATKSAADAINKAVTTGGTTAAAAMNKGVTTGGNAAADAAAEASKIGAATLDKSFGVGADSIGSSVASNGDTAAAAITAAGNVMAAKFEGTGRNIYDLWNNWGNSFINSFGTSIGDLLIQFQRAQTEQLEAQARLMNAQAALVGEQAKYLRDNGQMPGTAGSGGGSGGGGGNDNGTTTSSFGFGNLGDDNDRRRRRRNGGGGGNLNIGTDITKDTSKNTFNERGNIDLPNIKIVNQNNPQDTLDNLNTSKGGQTIINVLGNNRRKARAILGIRG